ncbi:hypothetical protein [Bacteriovorax sp. BSW11_IV]|uniref:hypothetical protein n=1 Tax=Bacteriovorax sp. BSW11_IV TaxID=1353529 RepID=UPI0012DE4AA0|nr:hypothetical protein [Bacteriovorax sp. BSW11_IV]
MKLLKLCLIIGTFIFSPLRFASYLQDNGRIALQWSSYDEADLISKVKSLESEVEDEVFSKYYQDLLSKYKHTPFYKKLYFSTVGKGLLSQINELMPKTIVCKDSVEECFKKALMFHREDILLRLIYMQSKYQINMSKFLMRKNCDYCENKQIDFEKEELDAFILAMKIMPKRFHTYLIGRPITMINADNGLYGNGKWTFFIQWRYLNFIEKIGLAIHEFSHIVGTKSDLDFSKKWLELFRQSRVAGPYDGFISDYAYTNFAEDFAESLTCFIVSPKLLKKHLPSKYEFFKNSFKF